MIGFLQPLALFGLLAAAIPPILHLLARRHIPVVDFPAVTYLTETERRHSKQLRLHNLLLLLLRTLLIALIALAAGRPVTKVATGGSHEPTAVGVIVDNSLSSQSVVDGEWVMRSLLDRAWEVFEQTGEADLVWLMLADGLPRRVTRAEALVVLDTLTPWPLRLDLGRAVGNMAQVLSGEDLPREVVVFTDGQASAFSSSGRAFENIGEVPVLLWTPGETIPNRSIDSVRLEPPSWVAGGEVVVAVGGDEQEPSAVRVGIGERELARGVAAPGDHTILRGSSVALGWHAGFVELDADELRADDRRVFALRVTAPQAVAVSPTVGPFAVEGLAVLEMSGRVTRGEGVRIGTFDPASPAVVFPPADVADIGGLNRSLEILGIGWRFSDLVDGEWNVQGLDLLQQETVYRRWQLQGSGAVLVSVGGEPWIVRDKGVVIVASRLDPGWTTLPVGAAFIPFLDHLLNRYSARQEEVIE
ncbi:MAG: BatA domain-containing protein, partial [Gemmatimonadota bacterium]|nr:BatA domain-containing protein [Gemmatimonadota bacterium]